MPKKDEKWTPEEASLIEDLTEVIRKHDRHHVSEIPPVLLGMFLYSSLRSVEIAVNSRDAMHRVGERPIHPTVNRKKNG